jgi:hydroxyacyl-ACP dehydratase HTD2-like protein with hotdog domain
MPVGHHLVYFPTPAPSSLLLPDGTDPFQSPGEPFVRRMWAGGRMRFPHEGGPLLDATRAVCVEGIRDVTLKGKEGEEKVFVGIERRVALVDHEGEEEQEIRARVWLADEEDQGDAVVIERRNLVFLRERTPEELHAEQVARGKGGADRVVKPPQNPAFAHAIVPTPQLLFRYSALTFNAHSIHLDKEYCRTVEGHRNLLVHGPLSLTFMLTVLRHHLLRRNRVIREIDYRNLAPLYAEEEMRVCGREKGGGSGEWEVWVEGRDRGVAVKGSVRTEEVEEREAVDLTEQLFYEGFDAALGSVIHH